MRNLCILILYSLLSNALIGQSNYLLLWDEDGSSTVSSEGLITLHKGLSEFKDKHIQAGYWDEKSIKGKSLGVGYRFLRHLLLDIHLDYLVVAHQHEVFGHGARYREFGLQGNSYQINLAPPYGPGGAFARPGHSNGRLFGAHESISRASGGMEGSAVLAKTLRDKWMLKGEINYSESTLYLTAFHDYTAYILSTKLLDNDGDVETYLKRVNGAYGFNTPETYRLTLDNLSFHALVNLLNTYQLYALYAFLKVYLLDGDSNYDFQWLKLGNVQWLPSVRLGLTPFGSEFIIENHFLRNNDLLELSLRLGDGKLNSFWGAGFRISKNINSSLAAQVKADVWDQPDMELGGDALHHTKQGIGGRITGSLNWQFKQNIPLGFYAEAGYKTPGFIEGEALNKNIIVRLGLSLKTN